MKKNDPHASFPDRTESLRLLRLGKRPTGPLSPEDQAAWEGLEKLYQTGKLDKTLKRLDHRVNRRPTTIRYLRYLAVAMLVGWCLSLFFKIHVQPPDDPHVLAYHLPIALPQADGERGVPHHHQSNQQWALRAYADHSYRKALSFFQQYVQEEPHDRRMQLYYGICLIKTQRYYEAVRVLEEVRLLLRTPELRPAADWYLTVAYYYLSPNHPVVIAYLKNILHAADHPYRVDAAVMISWL